MTGRHVALLRGINVGGHHKLPMKALAQIVEDLGGLDVSTYIQSGNVVFSATAAGAKKLARSLGRAIAKEFGFEVPVVIRSASELRHALESHPFHRRGVETSELHFVFLQSAPSAAGVKQLDPKRSPPDEFVVKGQEVFVCCPNGVARSKLTNAYFDSNLQTISTARNWRTVVKLVEMSS
ncbi:MAG: DUF1697 domain-containing protein [Planctomycetota bacterium]